MSSDLKRLLGVLAPLAVIALALAVRLLRLGSPDELLVDEGYYVRGARDLLERGAEPSYLAPEPGRLPAVHPPLGKWMIALGMAAAGDNPTGWRIASAVAGTLTVALVYLCGRRLFHSQVAALAAAFLLAIEHLSVVQSRTAMLDIFLTLWLVAAAYALIRDHDAATTRPPDPAPAPAARADPAPPPPDPAPPLDAAPAQAPEDSRDRRRVRWWRLAAGVFLGCAVASKWSGAYVLPLAWLVVLGWELARRRRAGTPRPLRATFGHELPSVIGSLVLVPVAVYVASYAGTFATGTLNLVTWWENEIRVLLFHAGLDASHPYTSSALSWLVMRRPITYFFTRMTIDTPTGPADGVQEVLALGNPLIFLAIVPVAAWAAYRWLRHRDHALGALLLTAVALWLPWAFQNRPMFVFYMTPVIPFVVLLQAAFLNRLRRTLVGATTTAALLTAAAALFWFHWPILTATPITYDAWLLRVANWNNLPLFHFDWI